MASIPSGKTRDDIPEARDTNTNVVPYCAPNWRELGEALGMTAFQLDIINADHLNSCEERCKVMLQNWLKKDASATWGKLIDAVGILQTVSSVLSTTANGHMLEFSQHLKDWYIQTRYHAPDDGTEDMWQLLYPEHFVNVQLKRYHKKRKENEIASVASMMRAGLVKHIDSSSSQVHVFEKSPQLHSDNCTESIISEISDIFSPVQREDGTSMEPKMILINGAPGMGKTTLCKEIAFRWANRSLLMNNSLVFLLFLRDPGVQKIYELKDLIHFFYEFDPSADDLSKQLAEILIKRDNGDITILLDGFDEFSNTDKNLLVNKIISRKFLAQSKLVITSRPISSEKLQKVSDITVEVLGFTEESRMSFIKKELDAPAIFLS
ncbi:NACHT, LRR and PYD domains-containing protein 3-like [Dysidea avara]|uniref:NACHT, LRR and PYD domains-containing protein 3-like n=1 Tax=Dysidea avara TaxID=196820 RepID=UPI0033174B8C